MPLPPDEESFERIEEIQADAAHSILSVTGDKNLSQLVSSMLSKYAPRLEKVVERLTEK